MAETEKKESVLAVSLRAHEKEFRIIASRYMSVPRLLAVMTQASMRIPKLAQCTEVSILEACRKMAECGTDRIGAGGMWLIPFNNTTKGTMEVSAWPDWRLMVENARKAKVIKHASADVVYENDDFSYERGMNPNLIHKPALNEKGERGKIVAVYCIYTLPDGTKDFVVMTWAEVEEIRGRGAAWKAHLKYKTDNPWVTDPAEMAKKTVIKRALKIFEGASAELSSTMAIDNSANGFPDLNLLPEPIAEPKALAEPAAEKAKEKKPVDTTLPPEGEKTASVPASPADTTDKPPAEAPLTKNEQILEWAQDITGGDSKEMEVLFVKWGDFIPTKDKAGKLIPEEDRKLVSGKKNVYDYTGKWLNGVFNKAEKVYYAWKEAQNG